MQYDNYVLGTEMLICDLLMQLVMIMTTNIAHSCRVLTLKAPITTAADDIYKYFFIVFQRK